MREFISKHRTTIFVTSLTSLGIIYFIVPIFNGIARITVLVASSVSSTYTDRIYAQVAHLETIDFAFLVLSTLFGTLAIIMFAMSYFLIRFEFFPWQKGSDHKKVANSATIVATAIFMALMGLFLIVSSASDYWQAQIITSFKRDMRVLAPYLDDDEEERIFSRWSLMKGESDYEKIYNELRNVAEENGIELPENTIYSPYTI